MESEVALQLLTSFLQKRGTKIDLKKDPPALYAYGRECNLFAETGDLFIESEWKALGEVLWEKVIEDDKTAKKLMKPWKKVIDAIKHYQAEKKVAALATANLEGKPIPGMHSLGIEYIPSPPARTTIKVDGPSASAEQTAPLSQSESLSESEHSFSSSEEELLDEKPLKYEEDMFQSHTAATAPAMKAALSMKKPSGPAVRRIDWSSIYKDAVTNNDYDLANCIDSELQAFPVIFANDPQGGGMIAHYNPIDWKFLAQLRSTVSECGLHGEPSRQMLNYIWSMALLIPEDIKTIARMITTQSQLLLWQSHWQSLCDRLVHVPRQQGDVLYGVTLEQLMGIGNYSTIDMQANAGEDVIRASMRLAREALNRVRTAPPSPSYMSIKQGRDESFASFVDKVTTALDNADVQDWMKGALLRQCVLENSNAATKTVISTLPVDATVEDMLDRMSRIPTGPQAMLVNALKEVGTNIVQAQNQALAAQNQVLAALTPLQTTVKTVRPQLKCFRCGKAGHLKRTCRVQTVWCTHCNTNTHATEACRKSKQQSGNWRKSARGRGVPTPTAAPVWSINQQQQSPVQSPCNPQLNCGQPPVGASGWTWQQQ